ncbi:uncharacterized protein DC041_0011995 [Schistosoma bovis]|uniref:Uncharacterized protein n=1 Tax=Schistosoma bovis TaxID=6184 RepID=A0A430QU12_SCHBO|nr:uncharacterized protein DC041_0011995 [Schistosoma bovis]
MQTPDGVPAAFLEAKKEEIAKRQEDEKFVLEMRKRENELIQKGTNRTSNMSSEQIDNQKRVSSVKSNGVAESEEPETFTNRNRSTSRTASPAPQPPTTTESREKLRIDPHESVEEVLRRRALESLLRSSQKLRGSP